MLSIILSQCKRNRSYVYVFLSFIPEVFVFILSMILFDVIVLLSYKFVIDVEFCYRGTLYRVLCRCTQFSLAALSDDFGIQFWLPALTQFLNTPK